MRYHNLYKYGGNSAFRVNPKAPMETKVIREEGQCKACGATLKGADIKVGVCYDVACMEALD